MQKGFRINSHMKPHCANNTDGRPLLPKGVTNWSSWVKLGRYLFLTAAE